MIEAVRRRSPVAGPSAVRRLMTRPIHAHIAEAARPRPVALAEPPAPETPAAEPDAPELRISELGAPEETGDLARLRLEVLMMKAALSAERRESEALRACLGLAEDETLGEEARAVRARWAALVERLIHDQP